MKNLSKIFIATSLVVFASCDPDFDEPIEDIQVTSGGADFSKYIALGNSLTSGFTDNALFISGQQNSYPNMLATEMMMAGGGTFTLPLMPDEVGGFNGPSPLFVDGRLRLVINPETGIMGPLAMDAESPLTMVSGSVNNMGVPGAKSFHLLAPGYGNPAGIASGTANPYFVRFASSVSTTVLADAAVQQPTFFSLWIGNNDVLSYATSGGVGVNQTGNTNPATYGGNDISDPQVVAGSIQAILETLVNQGGAKGVIANIPSITDIPFFTTVPYAPLSPENPAFASQIPALNQQYELLNQIFVATGNANRQIIFSTDTASAVVIKDETLSDIGPIIENAILSNPNLQQYWPLAEMFGDLYGQIRPANANDLMVFTSQTVIGKKPGDGVEYIDHPQNGILAQLVTEYGLPPQVVGQFCIPGITYPLTDQWVLIPNEKEAVITATNAYNTAIRQLANAYDLAFVDAHAAMQQLSSQSGITYFGNTYTTTYVSGGAFSLDAVHLTGKGYAIVANYFIDAINQKYGSTLRNVNPNNYPGVIIP